MSKIKAVCISLFCCILSGCSDRPLPTVHEQLRQHILEAELGSAITISFAKKPAIPLPPLQDEAKLTRQLKPASKETRWAAYRLGEIKNKLTIESLIHALQDKNTEVAGRAAASIVA